jgi:hypothetical protein
MLSQLPILRKPSSEQGRPRKVSILFKQASSLNRIKGVNFKVFRLFSKPYWFTFPVVKNWKAPPYTARLSSNIYITHQTSLHNAFPAAGCYKKCKMVEFKVKSLQVSTRRSFPAPLSFIEGVDEVSTAL